MNTNRKHIAKVIVVAVLVTGVGTGLLLPAFATPGSNFAPSPISLGHFGALDVKADKSGKWDLFLKTKDATDIGIDRLTVASGGFSGWHSHAGPTFVTVTVGTIEWYDAADCSKTTYRVGDTFVEPANRAHYVRNETGAAAEFTAIQMRPAGTGGRINEEQPVNCQI